MCTVSLWPVQHFWVSLWKLSSWYVRRKSILLSKSTRLLHCCCRPIHMHSVPSKHVSEWFWQHIMHFMPVWFIFCDCSFSMYLCICESGRQLPSWHVRLFWSLHILSWKPVHSCFGVHYMYFMSSGTVQLPVWCPCRSYILLKLPCRAIFH